MKSLVPHLIGGVKLPEAIGDYDQPNGPRWLRGLAPINIFVGPNNSGKSRLLRALYSVIGEKREDIWPAADVADDIITAALKHDEAISPPEQASFRNTLREFVHSREHKVHLQQHTRSITKDLVGRMLSDENTALIQRAFFDNRPDVLEFTREIASASRNQIFREFANKLEQKYKSRPIRFVPVYVPALRGLRPIGMADSIESRIKQEYWKGKDLGDSANDLFSRDKARIFTGPDMYATIRRNLLGDLKQRESVREFERFLADRYFDSREVTLIPRESPGNDVLYVKIGDESEWPIHDLGDGIGQIILLTYPLFEHADKHLLYFLEEPELFLHPSLQRRFLETLAAPETTSASRQVFLATHSNHLLDATIDIDGVAVFHVKMTLPGDPSREKVGKIKVTRATRGDFSLLMDLGVFPSSVFLSNCTIWVEGITDRMYIRHFLSLLQAADDDLTPYAEDLHYSFVEYGGANITHWSLGEWKNNHTDPIDVESLCARAFVIADKDAGKAERHKALKARLSERVHILCCREIENLLTPEILIHVVHAREGKSDCTNPASAWEHRLKDEYLGTLIEQQVLKSGYSGRRYAAPSGTIQDKVAFARTAIDVIKSLDDLSADAVTLSRQILEFVKQHNPPRRRSTQPESDQTRANPS